MAEVSPEVIFFKKETFVSSKAMNVFLDDKMITIKETFLEDDLKNPRWNDERMSSLGATYKDE